MARARKKSKKKSAVTRRRGRRTRGIDATAKGLVQSKEPTRDNDWAKLDPAFRVRLAAALADLKERGTPFALVEGFRTVERQQWLFGSGRPGVSPFGRQGPIVTHRDGVQKRSNHQGTGEPGTGRGADCYPTRNGKVFIPPSTDSLWEDYANAIERQGLTAGHHWPKFKDSPHAELTAVNAAEALQLVRSLKVPVRKRPAPTRRTRGAKRGLTDAIAVPAAPPALEDKTAQALVAGSGLVMAEQGVPALTKEDIVNCTLFAQFAASSVIKDRTDVIGWYGEYFGALQKLGWVMTSQDFREYRQEGKTIEVHKAIMAVLGTVLGPAATTLAVVQAVIEGLEQVGSNNGWLTLFDREAVSEKVARFQLVTAQPSSGGLVTLSLFAFSLEARKKFTQVLFFKFRKSDATLRSAGGTASITEALLATVREPLRKKLEQAAIDFLASIDIPRPHG